MSGVATRPRSRVGHIGRHPHCPQCGYDLVVTVHEGRRTCPECGYDFEMDELRIEVRPGDWTVTQGVRRAVLALLGRAAGCIALWLAIIWVVTALQRAIGPGAPVPLGAIVSIGGGLLILASGALVGVVMARRIVERAGFQSVLLVALVTAFTWAVLLVTAEIAVRAGLTTWPQAGMTITIAGAVALTLIAKTMILDEA